ncbi:FecR/PupR family sigma factor regulator [Frateuria aurantia]
MEISRLSDVALKAVDWAVLLSSGELSEEGYRQFEQWLGQSADHRQAWRRLHGLLKPLENQTREQRVAIREALDAAARERRNYLKKGLCVVAATSLMPALVRWAA